MKKTISWAAAVSIAAALFLVPTKAVSTSAHSAVLMDGITGRILYEHNADEKSLIASTTKIMTGLLICEQCALDNRVQIRPEAVGIEGSSMYLQEGELLSVQDLLYGLMLRSGNDAAVALALYCDGSIEGFAQRMNNRAQQMGLHSTHFQNPHGLDHAEHYSTARDLAILAAEAMKNPQFHSIVSTKSITVGARTLTNHNKLLWQYAGAVGVKTGYTKSAGRILVSAAERDGRRLIAVTINDKNDWQDHATLLDYGFAGYTDAFILAKDTPVLQVPVLSGTAASVAAAAKEDFRIPLFAGEPVVLRLHLPHFVYAPIRAGSTAGEAVILVDGKEVTRIPLYWTAAVERKEINKWDALKRRLGG